MARPTRPRRSRGTLIPLILLLVVGSTAFAWYGGFIPPNWKAATRQWLTLGRPTPQAVSDTDVPPPEETAEQQLAKAQIELSQLQQHEPSPDSIDANPELADKLPRGLSPPDAPPVPGQESEADLGVGLGQDPRDDVREAKARTGVKRAVFEEETLPNSPTRIAPQSGKPARKAPRKINNDTERTGASTIRHVPVTASVAPEEAALKGNVSLVDLNTIQGLFDKGDIALGHRELSRWFWKEPARRDELRKQLDDSARQIYFAPQPHFEEPYVIQPGDQLRSIAGKRKLTWEFLAKLNRVDPKKIRAGQKLKVTPGPFAVLVSLSRYELIVHQNGNYVKSYSVGLGKESSTPLGTFKVQNKEKNPTYYGPPGIGVIQADDPKNPLGERWIDIGDSYGIHGTIDPESIGKNESRGCVRMLNSDVEEVYDFLVIGSEVRIVR